MALQLLPDTETLVVSYLRSVPEVTALTSNRISWDWNTTPSFPAVRLQRIGGLADTVPHWIDHAQVDVHCYGRTKSEASQVARTVRAALWAMNGGYAQGTVTDVTETLGLSYQPDPDLPRSTEGKMQPRYIFAVIVTVHPS